MYSNKILLRRAFSLVQTMVAVAIVGILATLSVSTYNDHILKNRIGGAFEALDQIRVDRLQDFSEYGYFPNTSLGIASNSYASKYLQSVWFNNGVTTIPGYNAGGSGGNDIQIVGVLGSISPVVNGKNIYIILQPATNAADQMSVCCGIKSQDVGVGGAPLSLLPVQCQNACTFPW